MGRAKTYKRYDLYFNVDDEDQSEDFERFEQARKDSGLPLRQFVMQMLSAYEQVRSESDPASLAREIGRGLSGQLSTVQPAPVLNVDMTPVADVLRAIEQQMQRVSVNPTIPATRPGYGTSGSQALDTPTTSREVQSSGIDMSRPRTRPKARRTGVIIEDVTQPVPDEQALTRELLRSITSFGQEQ